MPNRALHTGWPLVALLAAWAAFWWPVLGGADVLYVRDLNLFGGPSKHYLAERLAAGEFPFWTPLLSAGMPFFADVSNQVLYPLNALVLAAASTQQGLSWFVAAHSLLALAGFYALARTLALPRPVAVWAAAVFALSGYVLSMSDNINYLPACGWAPLGLAAVLRAFAGSSARWTAAAALCVACLLLAGDALNAAVLLALAAVLGGQAGWRAGGVAGAARALAVPVAAAVLAVLLAGVQILPTLELSALSVRQAGLGLADLGQWSFPPRRLLEFVQPFFFGSYYPAGEFLGAALYAGRAEGWAASVYLGPVPVALAVLAALARARDTWPWVLALAVALLLACGRHLPGFATLVDGVPFLGTQRFPEKFLFWVNLCACVLAACGAHAALAHAAARLAAPPRRRLAARAAASVMLPLLAFHLLLDAPGRAWIPDLGESATVFWHARGMGDRAHLQVLLLHLAAVLVVVVVAVLWVPRRWQPHALAALLAFAVLDLAWVHHAHVLRAPGALFDGAPRPAAARAIDDRAAASPPRIYFDDHAFGARERDFVSALTPWILGHFASRADAAARGYRHLFLALQLRERLAPNAAVFAGIGYLNGRGSPLQPLSHLALERAGLEADPWHLMATSAVEFVLTTAAPAHRRWQRRGFEEVLSLPDVNLRLLRVVNNLPRAFVAAAGDVEARAMDTASAVLPRVNPGQQRLRLREAPASGARGFPVHAVLARRSRPARHVIDVDSPHARGWLTLNESLFPGWTATVDGEPATLHLMNERFMAVAVPAGRHRVELRYRPTQLAAGLSLSLLGAALCAGLLAGPCRWCVGRRRVSPRPCADDGGPLGSPRP